MSRAPKRRTWTKVHLTFFTTPSHAHIGADALLFMVVCFCMARWDGESPHAEVRHETGRIVPLRVLAGLCQLPLQRVNAALEAAVGCGTLAIAEDGGHITIPNFAKWQVDPRTLRRQKQRGREANSDDAPPPDLLEETPPAELPEATPPPDGNPWRRDLEELRRRHEAFVAGLPEGPRRLRVVWLLGTPREMAEGLARETTWVAEVLFRGALEPARAVLHQVFEHAWRRAYAGELDERHLAKSLWGQAFRARLREWADVQLERYGERGTAESQLTWEQLQTLGAQAAKRFSMAGARSA